MLSQLPERIEPIRLAAAGQVIAGKIAVSKMQRLATLLSDSNQEAAVELKFRLDDAGQPIVEGCIESKLKLLCQRCMEPMSFLVNAVVNLGFVQNQIESERLPSNYEPFIVDEPQISLCNLIEDELLLALPVAAMHPIDECKIGQYDQFSGDQNCKNEKATFASTRAAIKRSENLKCNDYSTKIGRSGSNEVNNSTDSNPFAQLADLKIKSK